MLPVLRIGRYSGALSQYTILMCREGLGFEFVSELSSSRPLELSSPRPSELSSSCHLELGFPHPPELSFFVISSVL
jgi:hypothetical protein